MQKKRGLGKGLSDLGLDELLSDLNDTETSAEATAQFKKLPIDVIHPGRYQPRRQIDKEQLEELASSIRAQGIIQPIVVRRAEQGYEIIAGERRWRAAQLAGLTEIPAIVRDLTDEAAMAMSLIENIQRQDLNVMEEAVALQRLIDEFQMTHHDVADAVGKSRVSVTNILRLLKLNHDVQRLVEQGLLDMGHARALLALDGLQQSDIAKKIVSQALSVRETERLVHQLQSSANSPERSLTRDPDISRLEKELSDKLAASVSIHHQAKGKGKLIIQYNSLDELSGILDRIN